MPSSISWRIISSESHAGPIVHTIFARRCKGAVRGSVRRSIHEEVSESAGLSAFLFANDF